MKHVLLLGGLLGVGVALVVLCGGWAVGAFDGPAGPPIVIPTTYGPPSTGVAP